MKLPHWNAYRTSTGRVFVSLAVREAHVARHGVTVKRQPLRALHSLARSAGDFLFGAFQPVSAAW